MTEFLVECYASRTDDAAAVARRADSARRGAEELAGEGTPVRFVRSIFVPADETCFLVYEAASGDAVRAAARRAALSFEHIAEAFPEPDDAFDRAKGAPAPTVS